MKVHVTVRFKDGTEFTSVVECEPEKRDGTMAGCGDTVSADAVLRRKIRMIQKRHPGATIEWREEVDA